MPFVSEMGLGTSLPADDGAKVHHVLETESDGGGIQQLLHRQRWCVQMLVRYTLGTSWKTAIQKAVEA